MSIIKQQRDDRVAVHKFIGSWIVTRGTHVLAGWAEDITWHEAMVIARHEAAALGSTAA